MNGQKGDLSLKAVSVLLRLLLRSLKRDYDVSEVAYHLVDGRFFTFAFIVKERKRQNVGGLVHSSELSVQLTNTLVVRKGDRDLAYISEVLKIKRGFDCLSEQHFEVVCYGIFFLLVFKINSETHFSVHFFVLTAHQPSFLVYVFLESPCLLASSLSFLSRSYFSYARIIF